MAKKRRKKNLCPNCNKGLQDWMNYCPKCGQENHVKRASLSLLTKDFLQDYWTFDSKFFRSIIPLLFKPGYLTNEFIEGRRQKYIPPVRLYLFISFIFFLTSSLLVNKSDKNSNKEDKMVSISYGNNETKKDSLTIDRMHELTLKNPVLKAQYGDISKDSLKKVFETDPNMKEALEFMRKTESKDFDEFFNKHFTKLFFILIPILALIFFLLFYRKNFFYVDYLVFTIHIQSFYFLILFIALFVNLVLTPKWVGVATLIFLFIYTIIASKKVFKTTYLGSVLRLSGVTALYIAAFAISFLILIFLAMLLL